MGEYKGGLSFEGQSLPAFSLAFSLGLKSKASQGTSI